MYSAFPQYGALYIAPFPPAVLAEDAIVVNPLTRQGAASVPSTHPVVAAGDVLMAPRSPRKSQGANHDNVAGGDLRLV